MSHSRVHVRPTQGPKGDKGDKGDTGLAGGINYEHTQSTPSAEWTINHNLGVRPNVQVFSSGGSQVMAEVLHVTINQLKIFFNNPCAGTARLN